MRPAKDTDFLVDLEGVGKFRFARRTFGDRIKIRGEIARMSRDFGDDLDSVAEVSVVAIYKTLIVSCPKGWEDIEAIDLVEHPEAEEQAWQLFIKLNDAEDRFREERNKSHKKDGQKNSALDSVLVSTAVSPAAK